MKRKFGRRTTNRGWSIKNPLGKNIILPEKMDEKELDELVTKLRSGVITDQEKQKMYMGHIRLAVSIVSEYLYRGPHLEKELIGAAMLAIGKAIEKAPAKLIDNNITPFISVRVRGDVLYELSSQTLMPSSTVRLKIKQGLREHIPHYVNLKVEDSREFNIAEEELRKNRQKGFKLPLDNDDQIALIILNEELERCINHDADLKRREYKRVILRLRAAGYNNEEIAQILEISESYVQKLISEVKEKFQKRL